MLKIDIPDNLNFADLELNRNYDGKVLFNTQVIEQICDLNGLDRRVFLESDEAPVVRLVLIWYAQHLAAGGKYDLIAEDLIAEIKLVDERGDITYPEG